ncbi:hypothetical protein D9M71_521730 [compost metagenome]
MVGLGIGFPEQPGQPVTPDALLVQRFPQVEGALLVIVVTHLQLHFTQWLDSRPLAHQIDLSAGVGGAVKYRAGTAQHLDTFQAIGFGGIPAEKLRQEGARTITQHAPGALLKTANGQLVGHKLRAGKFGIDAWRITQGLCDGLGLLGFNLLAGNYRNRVWRFHQWCVGLGAGRSALGHIAVVGAHGAVGLTLDTGGRQGHRRVVTVTL